MSIWSAEIKELEKLYESFKGQFPDLENELERLIKADDENMILLYSRRCLEVIISELCECELKRPRKTEPLQGIIDKLHKEEKVPAHIIGSMHGLNELSTYGAHPKDFDPKQVRTTLINLETIIEWYIKYKKSETKVTVRPAAEIRQEIKSAEDVKKSTQIPKKRLIGLISGFMLLIVIVVAVLFLTNIIGTGKEPKELEKSIAVLPFKLLSDEPDKQYLADGMMEAITLHLSKIKDLRVIGRTSVEQYCNPSKTTTAIGRELGVAYLLEGSFQKFGDKVKLIFRLIKTGKEGHVWANEYDRNWSDIFAVQSEVAQTVAAELYASISQEEKSLIEKVPTSNMTAYNLYLVANSYLKEYEKNRDLDSYHTAVNLYEEALKIDSAFAKAYTGLAKAYNERFKWETYFNENYLDSIRVLADKALSFDDLLDEAFYLKGVYYKINGQSEKAMNNLDKALQINPNYYLAYVAKGGTWISNDFIKSLENYHKALNLIRGDERSNLLRNLALVYHNVGLMDKAKYYYKEAVQLDGDSVLFFDGLAKLESAMGNYENAILFGEKSRKIDSTFLPDITNYSFAGQHQKAYILANKEIEKLKKLGELPLAFSHRIGYAFAKNGKDKEARYYFNQQIKNCEESINLNREYAREKYAYYDLAGVYSYLGDKIKAYQYLDNLYQLKVCPLWWLSYIKNDPLFESIRNEERFQKILQNMEAKYQAEHERVKKWIGEQGML